MSTVEDEEMFKIGYYLYDPKAAKELFDLNKRDTSINVSKVLLKKVSLEVRKHYFTIRAARDWNALPSEDMNSKTTNDFKIKLENSKRRI